jgi:hypothetical protein
VVNSWGLGHSPNNGPMRPVRPQGPIILGTSQLEDVATSVKLARWGPTKAGWKPNKDLLKLGERDKSWEIVAIRSHSTVMEEETPGSSKKLKTRFQFEFFCPIRWTHSLSLSLQTVLTEQSRVYSSIPPNFVEISCLFVCLLLWLDLQVLIMAAICAKL